MLQGMQNWTPAKSFKKTLIDFIEIHTIQRHIAYATAVLL